MEMKFSISIPLFIPFAILGSINIKNYAHFSRRNKDGIIQRMKPKSKDTKGHPTNPLQSRVDLINNMTTRVGRPVSAILERCRWNIKVLDVCRTFHNVGIETA